MVHRFQSIEMGVKEEALGFELRQCLDLILCLSPEDSGCVFLDECEIMVTLMAGNT